MKNYLTIATRKDRRFSSKWLVVFLGVVAALLVSASPLRATPISYYFVDYPAAENGHTLSGYLTTDGTIGALKSTDVTGGQYVIDGTVYPITAAGMGVGQVYASSTQVTMTFGSIPNDLTLTSNSGGYQDHIGYHQNNALVQDNFQATDKAAGSNVYYWNLGGYPGAATYLGSTTWIVATTTVPEPTSLAILVSALLGLAGFLFVRRRQRGAA
jgi:hypothetical protein